MFHTMLSEPWANAHIFIDIVEKYNAVCHVVQEMSNIIKQLENKIEEIEHKQKTKTKKSFLRKCRYFNAGYCKEEDNCPFIHPEAICGDYLDSGQCSQYRNCPYQHPRVCRFWSKTTCYRGADCCYLHQKVEQNEPETTIEEEVNTKETNLVTVEVNGKKRIIDNINQLDKDEQKALTVDDYLKIYEAGADDITKLIGEEADVEQEAVSIEYIMKFYEDKSEDEIVAAFKDVSNDNMDTDEIEAVNVNLKRSTRKVKKSKSKERCQSLEIPSSN